MAKLFSFASWNVEHFTNAPDRVRENIEFIQQSNPDVFAIFEVQGKQVFSSFVDLMPTHNFFITEGLSVMEILVGVNRKFTAFVTQRQQFKSQVPTLRPGALVTLTTDLGYYSLLFLHMKSMDDPRSWGLRDDVTLRVAHLKHALDQASGDSENGAKFLCLGDFNTMGMNLTFSDKDVDGLEELTRYQERLSRNHLKYLEKDAPHTWWGGMDSGMAPSDLDHVFTSDHLKFTKFGTASVSVRGWPQKATPEEQTDWIQSHSDHAMLYGEVLE